jgi:hypothetical protein
MHTERCAAAYPPCSPQPLLRVRPSTDCAANGIYRLSPSLTSYPRPLTNHRCRRPHKPLHPCLTLPRQHQPRRRNTPLLTQSVRGQRKQNSGNAVRRVRRGVSLRDFIRIGRYPAVIGKFYGSNFRRLMLRAHIFALWLPREWTPVGPRHHTQCGGVQAFSQIGAGAGAAPVRRRTAAAPQQGHRPRRRRNSCLPRPPCASPIAARPRHLPRHPRASATPSRTLHHPSGRLLKPRPARRGRCGAHLPAKALSRRVEPHRRQDLRERRHGSIYSRSNACPSRSTPRRRR